MFEPVLGFLKAGVAGFFGAEGARVVKPSAADDAGGVFDVEHFVKEDVFDEPARHIGRYFSLTERSSR